MSEANQCIGSWIMINDGAVTVDGIKGYDYMYPNCICTQIDQADRRKLSERGKQIAKRWSRWNAYEITDGNFVRCIRRALGSGINVTKLTCTQCKLGSQRECRHETACGKVLKESGQVSMNENGELQELGPVINDTEVTRAGRSLRSSEYWDSCSDRDEDEVKGSANPEVEVGNRSDGMGNTAIYGLDDRRGRQWKKCIYEAKSFFTSKKWRPLYTCPAE